MKERLQVLFTKEDLVTLQLSFMSGRHGGTRPCLLSSSLKRTQGAALPVLGVGYALLLTGLQHMYLSGSISVTLSVRSWGCYHSQMWAVQLLASLWPSDLSSRPISRSSSTACFPPNVRAPSLHVSSFQPRIVVWLLSTAELHHRTKTWSNINP